LKVPRIRPKTISVTSQQWEDSAVTLAEHPRPKEGKHRGKEKKQKKRKKRRAHENRKWQRQGEDEQPPSRILKAPHYNIIQNH
jgi:hypothetical protein